MVMLSKLNSILILLIILAVSNKVFAQRNDSTLIVQLIKDDYATMGSMDSTAHLRNVTSDYHLIEKGEIWDIQTELDSIYRLNSNRSIVRSDFFTIKTVKIKGDMAYAFWHLRSEFRENGKLFREVAWIESGVFRKEQERWKIALIHSSYERRK